MQVEMRGISKQFGPVAAVRAADLTIRAGQVLALLGENGAGKSTLMKLLFGVHAPDAGSIAIDGRAAAIASPRDALKAGLAMVFQQPGTIAALSVRENLALAAEGLPWWTGRRARRLAQLDAGLRAIAPDVDPEVPAGSLPLAQLQLVEIAKAMLREARCLVLDEPSAVLAPAEAERLWALVGTLRARGVSVVLITHKLADVRACADEVAVMRAGRVVAQASARAAPDARIVEWMVGQAPPAVSAPALATVQPQVRLELRDVYAGPLAGVQLRVRHGEILGIAGMAGSGQAALCAAVQGSLPLAAGEVLLEGETLRAPRRPVRPAAGLGCIPEEPLRNAVAPDLPLATNLALKQLRALPFRLRRQDLDAAARPLLARFDVRPADPACAAGTLSGGNLQKLVAAREIAGAPAAVVACHPTMGLDVAATRQLHEALFNLARSGTAVLWISEELEDLLRHAHRIAVMRAGRIVAVRDAAATNLQELGHWMAGAAAGEPQESQESQGCPA